MAYDSRGPPTAGSVLYSVRSERLLMEEIDYSILYPLVCGAEQGRSGMGRHRLHEEPRPAAGSGSGQGVSGAGSRAAAYGGIDSR